MTTGRSTSGRGIGAILAGLALQLIATATAAGDLRDFVTELYDGNGQAGVQLADPRGGQNLLGVPDFEQGSFRALQTLGAEIASSLSFLSGGGGGSSYVFDFELGVPVETSETFGPLVAERADTIGARRLSLALSYTSVVFKRFNGDSLSDLSLTVVSNDLNVPPDGRLGPPGGSPIELDQVRIDLDIDIEQDVFALLGKYGMTEFWEAEMIIPLVRISARAHAQASVVCNQISEILCTTNHRFGTLAEGSDSSLSSSGGTATGIGDMLVRSKYNFLHDQGRWPDLAFRGQIKLATGEEKDLLGTGETDFQLALIASKTWSRFTPHLNLGYELSTGPKEFDNLVYAVGFEASAHQRLTLALDVIGRWAPYADRVADNVADIALGARWNVWRKLLVNTNFQFPLNRNTGLRPNVMWTVGVEYRFGGG